MLEAKDILLIVLAFCALWFTAFVCWLIYQVARILRNVNDVVEDVHETLGKMERALAGIRGHADRAMMGLMTTINGGAKIVDLLSRKKKENDEEKKATKSTSKTRKK